MIIIINNIIVVSYHPLYYYTANPPQIVDSMQHATCKTTGEGSVAVEKQPAKVTYKTALRALIKPILTTSAHIRTC